MIQMLHPQASNEALSTQEKLDWLRLFRTENIGPITFYRLIERYGSAEKALNALPDLSKRGGRAKPLTAPPPHTIEKEYEMLRKKGGDLICASEPLYPLALAATEDAPPVLSYFGNLRLTSRFCIAMVGARNASINGRKFAEKLARDLGAQDKIIVSGLARGVDTSAHIGALETGTIAVIAGGLDVVYPKENDGLYQEIKEKGLILAESPLGMQPIAKHFPKRNRIVSGLSLGVVVVEATLRSGSLITARLAGEQGRDVYAVPGHPMDPRAQGPNKLIQDGAVLVQNADDILRHLSDFSGYQMGEAVKPSLYPAAATSEFDEPRPDNADDLILETLSYDPVEIDLIIRSTRLNASVVQGVLLEFELAGRTKRHPGGRVSLVG